MNRVLTLFLCLFSASTCWAQVNQTPTAADTAFFHYFLSTYDDGKAVLFGLNGQERAAAKAAAKSYTTALNAFASAKLAVESGKQTLSPAEQAAVRSLGDSFNNTVTTLAASFLSSIRPERAAYLQLQAQLVDQAVAGVRKALQTAP